MIWQLQLTLTGGYLASFESRAIPAMKQKDDPFSLPSNRWRIRATHKETDAEIRNRLFNHCQFWENYFRWALDKSLATVDVRSTPTLIRIYGNGFTLKPTEDLPAEWVAFFYDAGDCAKANGQTPMISARCSSAASNRWKIFYGRNSASSTSW